MYFEKKNNTGECKNKTILKRQFFFFKPYKFEKLQHNIIRNKTEQRMSINGNNKYNNKLIATICL